MRDLKPYCAVALAVLSMTTSAKADQVINDDLIVTSSICVGFDCVNGEAFDFDTLRLKENNTRMQFNDTSVGSFPTNNWQIRANSSLSGGGNFLGFVDQGATGTSESGTIVFSVAAGAGSNALFVNAGGNVGFGNASPVVKLHATNGNTPTLRLEQNGSAGFNPQTWDLAGNETNFFIRDVTGGSRLVFRIQPNAPSNSIFVASSGNVGLGTSSPEASLDIKVTATPQSLRTLLQMTNNGDPAIRMRNTGNNNEWQIRAGGSLIMSHSANFNDFLFNLNNTSGDLTIKGGLITTGGGGACTVGDPCDAVFDPAVYTVPSIEQHAALMWQNKHLPAVGPTSPDAPINMTEKMLRMLNELEHAHIYIEQLNKRIEILEAVLR